MRVIPGTHTNGFSDYQAVDENENILKARLRILTLRKRCILSWSQGSARFMIRELFMGQRRTQVRTAAAGLEQVGNIVIIDQAAFTHNGQNRLIFQNHITNDEAAIQACMLPLIKELTDRELGYELAIKSYLYRLLTILLRKYVHTVLHNTPLTISEIAIAIGYQDIYYFSRTFKKYKKLAPSEVRKNFQTIK